MPYIYSTTNTPMAFHSHTAAVAAVETPELPMFVEDASEEPTAVSLVDDEPTTRMSPMFQEGEMMSIEEFLARSQGRDYVAPDIRQVTVFETALLLVLSNLWQIGPITGEVNQVRKHLLARTFALSNILGAHFFYPLVFGINMGSYASTYFDEDSIIGQWGTWFGAAVGVGVIALMFMVVASIR